MQDFDIEQQQIQNRLKRYQSQGYEAPQGQMVGRRFVAPNVLQQLAAGLRGYGAIQGEQQARQELQDLQGKRREAETRDMSAFVQALRGTPAVAENAPSPDFEGNVVGPTMPAQAARPGDPFAAYSMAAASQSPMIRQMGMRGMAEIPQMEAQKLERQEARDFRKSEADLAREARKAEQEAMRGQRMQELQMRLEDQRLSQQERLAAQREMRQMQMDFQRENQKMMSAMRPERQAQIIQTDQGPMQLVGGQAVPIMGPGGVPVRAKAGPEKEPTEGERKAGTLLTRLRGSQAQLDEVTRKNPSAASPNVVGQALSGIGMESAGNLLTSSDRQRVNAAQLDLLDSALTLGTGAAYTREQLEGYRKSYFPQIGDSPATIKDKQDRLNNVIAAAEVGAGRAEPQAKPRFGPAANPATPKFDQAKEQRYQEWLKSQGR